MAETNTIEPRVKQEKRVEKPVSPEPAGDPRATQIYIRTGILKRLDQYALQSNIEMLKQTTLVEVCLERFLQREGL